ncbi:hypothetical protein HRI_004600500 [Hibiscus trionum]|uniref:Uncharacterized protein n=1 Tax=Hibiscus trionum TaxID=183268 RepID=A0A9W7JAJ7_HIBTR|nr:hypothetical protein HRI_004600500 [Hibiscus trionum]
MEIHFQQQNQSKLHQKSNKTQMWLGTFEASRKLKRLPELTTKPLAFSVVPTLELTSLLGRRLRIPLLRTGSGIYLTEKSVKQQQSVVVSVSLHPRNHESAHECEETCNELTELQRMKVERQISASLYAMNGVEEYMETANDSTENLWDLPALCSLFY